MKLDFKKIVSVLIVITAIADTHFELLKQLGIQDNIIGYIKVAGLIFSAFLPSIKSFSFTSKEIDNTDPQKDNPKVRL